MTTNARRWCNRLWPDTLSVEVAHRGHSEVLIRFRPAVRLLQAPRHAARIIAGKGQRANCWGCRPRQQEHTMRAKPCFAGSYFSCRVTGYARRAVLSDLSSRKSRVALIRKTTARCGGLLAAVRFYTIYNVCSNSGRPSGATRRRSGTDNGLSRIDGTSPPEPGGQGRLNEKEHEHDQISRLRGPAAA